MLMFLHFACRDLLKLFTTQEVMKWHTLTQQYESELRNTSPGAGIFSSKTEEGQQRWKDLKVRVVEHVSSESSHVFMRPVCICMANALLSSPLCGTEHSGDGSVLHQDPSLKNV